MAYIIGQVPAYWVVNQKLLAQSPHGMVDQDDLIAVFTNPDGFAAVGIDQNYGLFLLLLMFVFAFLALWFCINKLHNRSLKTLITPFENINWPKVFFGFGIWMLFTFIFEIIAYFMDPGNYTFQFSLGTFLPLLLITIFILPIQTTIEELFFRGYLMQGIGLASKVKWVPLLITSLLFGFVHIANPEVQQFGMGAMMYYYVGVGLMLGIITIMDEGLELAIGIHAATNIFGAAFVTFNGSALQTAALFRVDEVNINLMIPAFTISAIVLIFVCSKKYGWNNWQKLFGRIPIETPQKEQHPV